MPVARQQTMFARSPLPDIENEDISPASLLDDVDDLTDTLPLRMKFQILINGVKEKFSCCRDGKEGFKSGILG